MNLEDISSSLQPPKRRYYRAFFKNQVLGAENLGSHSSEWCREEHKPQTRVSLQLQRKIQLHKNPSGLRMVRV